MELFKVSNSRIKMFRGCHYAHYLKYVKKLVRKVKEAALQRGSIIHECIEAYNSGKSWKKPLAAFEKEFYQKTFAEERVEMGDLPKIAKSLLENYFHYYEDEPLEYVANELHFELPITKDIIIEGYIDAVVKDENDKVWAMETKTYSKSPDRDFLMFNTQSAIYTWALGQLGTKAEGTLWNIIKAKEPSKPQMTEKTGKLSLAKIDSTPYTVIKGIKELGLDPKDFKEYIDKFSYEDFFYRHPIRLNKRVVDSIMKDTESTAIEIYEKGEKLKDRNLDKDCSWCSYRSICQAELLGLDTEFIINNEYEIKEKGGREDGKKEDGGKTQKVKGRK